MTDIPTQSAARTWPPIARFAGLDAQLGAWALANGPIATRLYEFLRFGIKQGWAWLFGELLCALLIASYLFYPAHAAIYLNFFTHHYVVDIRLGLFASTAVLFGRTWVHFKVWRVHRKMPLLLGFLLVAQFIWFAENIGTGTRG